MYINSWLVYNGPIGKQGNAMFQVVVRKFMEVGIKRVRFTGSNEECIRWMSKHRWGYYDLLGPDGRLRSFVLKQI